MQQAIMRAQVNSLYARFPQIRFEVGGGPACSTRRRKFEDGFIFLPHCKDIPLPLSDDKLLAFKAYWSTQPWPNADAWPNAVCRWVKLQLPNGQKAHSVWYESSVNTKLCRASCVEVSFFDSSMRVLLLTCTLQIKQEGGTRIANIRFYFYI